MNLQTPVNSPTQQPQNSGSANKRWSILGVIFIILILGIGAVVGYSYYKSNTTTSPHSPQPTAAPKTTMSGLEIATQTATFLDKSILPDGDFKSVYACHKDRPTEVACITSQSQLGSFPKLNGFISLAYLNLFKKTNDTHYKENGEKAISFILAQCQKDKTYCLSNLHALYAWYKETNDPKYKNAMLQATDFLLAKETLNQSVKGERAIPLWIMYDVTQDHRFKDRIETVAKGLLEDKLNKQDPDNLFSRLIYKEGDFEVRGYQILATNYFIAAYKTTNNPIYLKAAQDFFDKAKVQLHFEDFKALKTTLDLSTLEYLLDLAEISEPDRKQILLDQAQIFAQATLLSFWDNPVNKIYNGDFGFISNYENSDGVDKKLTFHNGMRANQFLRLSDQIFNLK